MCRNEQAYSLQYEIHEDRNPIIQNTKMRRTRSRNSDHSSSCVDNVGLGASLSRTYKPVFTFEDCKGKLYTYKHSIQREKRLNKTTETICKILPTLNRPTMVDVILAVQKSSIYPKAHVLRNVEAHIIKKATCEILDDTKIPPTRKELKMARKVLSISDEMRSLMKRKENELVKKYCTRCGSKRIALPYGESNVKFVCSKRCKPKDKTNIQFCAKSGSERPLKGLCRCEICALKNESKWKENIDKWRVEGEKKKDEVKKKKRRKKNNNSETKPIKRKTSKSFKTISTRKYQKRVPSALDDIIDESPKGFPEGWKVIIRYRGKRRGKSKGKYKLYISPEGSSYRSLVEVQNYLNGKTTTTTTTTTIRRKRKRKRSDRETVVSSGSTSSSPPPHYYEEDEEEQERESRSRTDSASWFRVAIPKRAGGPGAKFRIRIPGKEYILTSVIPENKTAGDLVYIDTSSVEQDADSGAMMVMSYSEIPTVY